MYSFDGAIGLWMVGGCPDLGNTQKVTQLRYYLPRELGCLVGHQSSRKPEHQEKLIVQKARGSMCSMVVGNIRLGIVCKMVLDDQDILHDGFLFHTHGHFHGHIVNMYQIHGSVQRMGSIGGIWGLASSIRHFSQLRHSSSSFGPCLATRIFL